VDQHDGFISFCCILLVYLKVQLQTFHNIWAAIMASKEETKACFSFIGGKENVSRQQRIQTKNEFCPQ